ncbi:hypothetical protein ACE3MZ_16880 [Paenibacillus sp. WLX1005]|uniref:hypothetical protein n=1 Tax=Paenibacillus sp. WLX1005 TaxID=3243766 RepID=UPI003984170B
MDELKEFRRFLRFLFLLMPTILTTMLLIKFFPYTGLGRIVTVPFTFLINIFIVGLAVLITYRKRWFVITKVTLTIMITTAITIKMYPQDSGISVVQQAKEAVQAIQHIGNLDRSYLQYDGYNHEEEYVVALYKFRNEIPMDGTYQLYDRENLYFYGFTIHNMQDIPKKLIGHHKLMWLYMLMFK